MGEQIGQDGRKNAARSWYELKEISKGCMKTTVNLLTWYHSFTEAVTWWS